MFKVVFKYAGVVLFGLSKATVMVLGAEQPSYVGTRKDNWSAAVHSISTTSDFRALFVDLLDEDPSPGGTLVRITPDTKTRR